MAEVDETVSGLDTVADAGGLALDETGSGFGAVVAASGLALGAAGLWLDVLGP